MNQSLIYAINTASLNDCLIALAHIEDRSQVTADRVTTDFVAYVVENIQSNNNTEIKVLLGQRADFLNSQKHKCTDLYNNEQYKQAEQELKTYLKNQRPGGDLQAESQLEIVNAKLKFKRQEKSVISILITTVILLILTYYGTCGICVNNFNSQANKLNTMLETSPSLDDWENYQIRISGYARWYYKLLFNKRHELRLKDLLADLNTHIRCKKAAVEVAKLDSTGAYIDAELNYRDLKKEFPSIYEPHSRDLRLSKLIVNRVPIDLGINYIRDDKPFNISNVKKGETFRYDLLGKGQRTITFSVMNSTKKALILDEIVDVIPGPIPITINLRLQNGASVAFISNQYDDINVFLVEGENEKSIGFSGQSIDGLKSGKNHFILKKTGFKDKPIFRELSLGKVTTRIEVGKLEHTHGHIIFNGQQPGIKIIDANTQELSEIGDTIPFAVGLRSVIYTKDGFEDYKTQLNVIGGETNTIQIPKLSSLYGTLYIRDDGKSEILNENGQQIGYSNKTFKIPLGTQKLLVKNSKYPQGVKIEVTINRDTSNSVDLKERIPKNGTLTLNLNFNSIETGGLLKFNKWRFRLDKEPWSDESGNSAEKKLEFGEHTLAFDIPNFNVVDYTIDLKPQNPDRKIDIELSPKARLVKINCGVSNASITHNKEVYNNLDEIPLYPYQNNKLDLSSDGYKSFSTNLVFSPKNAYDFNIPMTPKPYWHLKESEPDEGSYQFEIGIKENHLESFTRLPVDLTIIIDDSPNGNPKNKNLIYDTTKYMIGLLGKNDRYRIIVAGKIIENDYAYKKADNSNIRITTQWLNRVKGRKIVIKQGNAPTKQYFTSAIEKALLTDKDQTDIRPDAFPVIVPLVNYYKRFPSINIGLLNDMNRKTYNGRLVVFCNDITDKLNESASKVSFGLFEHPNGPVLQTADFGWENIKVYMSELLSVFAKDLDLRVYNEDIGSSRSAKQLPLTRRYFSKENNFKYVYKADDLNPESISLKGYWSTEEKPNFDFRYKLKSK